MKISGYKIWLQCQCLELFSGLKQASWRKKHHKSTVNNLTFIENAKLKLKQP